MSDLTPPPPPNTEPPMSPPAGTPGAAGPIGKPRSVFMVLVLTVVTFGIWTVVWSYQNGGELKRYTNTGLGGVAYLFITLLISPVRSEEHTSELQSP